MTGYTWIKMESYIKSCIHKGRDERIRKLAEKYGEMGSGYPSDERTVRFLEEWVKSHSDLPNFVRKS